MSGFLSLYAVAAYYQRQGYEIVATDHRNWHGWSWLKMRMPSGQLVTVRVQGQ